MCKRKGLNKLRNLRSLLRDFQSKNKNHSANPTSRPQEQAATSHSNQKVDKMIFNHS